MVSDGGTAWPRPRRPRLPAATAYRVQPLVAPNPVYRRLAAWLERSPLVRRLFTTAERRSKQALFGCRMCGQCALPATGYACPMTCPKQLRNGPCGGVAANGDCEVHPGERCVWVIALERAETTGHGADLRTLQRPVDHRLVGSSSWVNYWFGRDDDLWTADDGLGTPPSIHRAPVDLGLPGLGTPSAAPQHGNLAPSAAPQPDGHAPSASPQHGGRGPTGWPHGHRAATGEGQ